MSRAKVQLDRVSRWYGDVMALNGVSLTLDGGVTGLLGPNGAGKSTMIRLVVGLSSPGDGSVTLDGEPVRNNLGALARIGYVADGDGIYEELTARRFLTDQAMLRGFRGGEAGKRAEEVLERVGLSAAIDQRIGGFSKGMRQRAKLAQAMLHDPDVLVLDEPLTGLDPVMRRDFIRVVRELGEDDVTILVSSHVLHEVEAMTNRVVLIHHGQVLAEGTVREIRDVLESHARRIRFDVADPKALGARLLGEAGDVVLSLGIADNGLIVETMRPAPLCSLVQDWVVDGSLHVESISALDEDLGSVFEYLVR